jgi:hypothetical protein
MAARIVDYPAGRPALGPGMKWAQLIVLLTRPFLCPNPQRRRPRVANVFAWSAARIECRSDCAAALMRGSTALRLIEERPGIAARAGGNHGGRARGDPGGLESVGAEALRGKPGPPCSLVGEPRAAPLAAGIARWRLAPTRASPSPLSNPLTVDAAALAEAATRAVRGCREPDVQRPGGGTMAGVELEEATIEGIQDAIRRREITAAELVRGYLSRIEAYDRAGPALNAVLATDADAALLVCCDGWARGPTHCCFCGATRSAQTPRASAPALERKVQAQPRRRWPPSTRGALGSWAVAVGAFGSRHPQMLPSPAPAATGP